MQNKNKMVTVNFTFPSKSSETNDVSLCASYRNVLFFHITTYCLHTSTGIVANAAV